MAYDEPNSCTSPTPRMRRSSFRMLLDAKLPISTALTLPLSDCSASSIKKPDDALVTATPSWRTSCGSRGSTRLRRSCTWLRATSRSVPGLSVTVICDVPLARLTDAMYRKLSTPFISSSMMEVTVRSMVVVSAPRKVAWMVIDGGAMFGYCSTGSSTTEIRPNSRTKSATTQANTGRNTKNEPMADSVRVWRLAVRQDRPAGRALFCASRPPPPAPRVPIRYAPASCRRSARRPGFAWAPPCRPAR